jgi:SMODS-associating 2TM, beta-strand rich effector domain
VEGYVVIRQTFLNLSLRLLTKESSSHLVTEIVCSVDGLYCVSGVYRNEPRCEDRSHSPIHYGAVWLQVIDTPAQMLEGHYWTDRNTAGEMRLTERQRKEVPGFSVRASPLRAVITDIRITMNIYGDAATADMREAHEKVVRLALARA